MLWKSSSNIFCSVGDPDPCVLEPPGSGSVIQQFGSGSFDHQAKIVIKTLIPTVLWLLYDFLYLRKWCKCTFKECLSEKLSVLKVKDENIRIRIQINWSEARIRGYGSRSVPKCHGSKHHPLFCLYSTFCSAYKNLSRVQGCAKIRIQQDLRWYIGLESGNIVDPDKHAKQFIWDPQHWNPDPNPIPVLHNVQFTHSNFELRIRKCALKLFYRNQH